MQIIFTTQYRGISFLGMPIKIIVLLILYHRKIICQSFDAPFVRLVIYSEADAQRMADNRKLMIRDLARLERPREKLIRYGPGRLSNTELLALILRSGKRGESAIALAGQVLKSWRQRLSWLLPRRSFADSSSVWLSHFLTYGRYTAAPGRRGRFPKGRKAGPGFHPR